MLLQQMMRVIVLHQQPPIMVKVCLKEKAEMIIRLQINQLIRIILPLKEAICLLKELKEHLKKLHPKKAELIRNNVIELAHRLDMISIAEGIELKNQLDMLKQMGCNVFQGYYFAKPMPLGDFEKLAA
jgi:c-di-GMP-related signal transduction protein